MLLGDFSFHGFEIADEFHSFQSIEPIGMPLPRRFGFPMREDAAHDLVLLVDWRDDEILLHAVGSTRSRDIVDIEIRDRRRDGRTMTIHDRIVQ